MALGRRNSIIPPSSNSLRLNRYTYIPESFSASILQVLIKVFAATTKIYTSSSLTQARAIYFVTNFYINLLRKVLCAVLKQAMNEKLD